MYRNSTTENAAITRFDHLPSLLPTPDTCAYYYMGVNSQHCSFVLLAEFDIDRGAQLTYQFPQPLGTDDGCVVIADNATTEAHLNLLKDFSLT